MINFFKKQKRPTFTTYDGTELVEGKKYRWSGVSDGLYTCYSWQNFRCKIRKIKDDKVHIYDYEDKVEYAYDCHQLYQLKATFK